MVTHYRSDLFLHPEEQQLFFDTYGYKLMPPKDEKQLIDVAKFFTRPAGSKLAGKTLQYDFYGVALMSGYAPHIGDEFSSLIWGLGGEWFKPTYRSETDQLDGYHIHENNLAFLRASEVYLQLLKSASPQALNSSWSEASLQFKTGQVAIFPFAYNNLWGINAQVEQHILGAKIAAAPVPLGRPYFGGYGMGIPIDARNTEGAYWLLKYLTSFEGQLANALNGGSPCRIDVVTHPYFSQPNNHIISGSYMQGHQAMTGWHGELRYKGHYSSIAMQHIYDELKEASYAVASQRLSPRFSLSKLNSKIKELQNQYGRHPIKLSPLKE